ncbi:NTP transferase domain-containing protein [Micromonospora sp. PLK6-60]|uniref:NTP transferase domain-containing protein n=1 Tax=Micromonospora sp. PLK6-60 TaxID=2873383 RepID=UPI001CA799B1|nr:NTP transferase domain-containing protein [Micromonospora sp. PLK6-60]MBY8873628.1 NTP transferase domain-containing protein [Micromonospora sp. PLK6-60]
MEAYAAVVLAGGAARRMGGVDKPARPVGGRPMRDRVLDAVADATPRILVGPPGPVPPDVWVTREEPPGGGPVAAVAAGLALLPPTTATVALLAADLPLLTRDAVGELRRRLAAAPPRAAHRPDAAHADAAHVPADRAHRPEAAHEPAYGARHAGPDGVCFVDGDGRRQTLCGVWRVGPLRAALAELTARRGGTAHGAPLRQLLGGLTVREVVWSGAGPPPWFDCDTDSDVRLAQEWTR